VLHLPDGTLRRAIDDVPSRAPAVEAHLISCSDCRARAVRMRERITRLESIFSAADITSALPDAEPNVLRAKTLMPKSVRKPWWPYAAAAIFIAFAAVVTYKPLRSLAAELVTVIREQVMRPVAITKQEAEALRGTVVGTHDVGEYSPKQAYYVGYLDKRTAERAANQRIATPSYIPASLANGYVIFHVRGAQSYKLRIPELNATLKRELPSVVEQTYGERQAYEHHRGLSAAAVGILPIPQGYLNVVQRPITPITIAGSTKDQLRDYFRKKSATMPAIAAALREGVDPLDHMILLRSDVQQVHPIEVLGVRGYAVKDARGFGNVVIWQKDRVMHMVEGTFSDSELLRVADSLHA
jgi:hypothetical protein